MACKHAQNKQVNQSNPSTETALYTQVSAVEVNTPERLLFGVDTRVPADDILQNNLTEFDWVTRNKLYPNFWGRYLTGEDHLTKEEIAFLHDRGCKIAALYHMDEAKETEAQGKLHAKKIAITAMELGIPENTAIFLEIDGDITTDYLKGYAQGLLTEGYTPGFKADTDASYRFDREYSRGMQVDREVFSRCLIWALSPHLAEYERITTTHLIHPDNWVPYAPSGITRRDIAVWQYGAHCHPIADDAGRETTFHVDLVRNDAVIMDKMF